LVRIYIIRVVVKNIFDESPLNTIKLHIYSFLFGIKAPENHLDKKTNKLKSNKKGSISGAF